MTDRSRALTALGLAVLLVAGSAPRQSAAGPSPSSGDLPRATPAEAGLDASLLTSLANDIRAGRFSNIHSLLVVRHGKLAFEAYFTGDDERRGTAAGRVRFDASRLHDVRSVTKSVTSLLVGIAHDRGMLSLEAPVLDYFPDYADLQTPERRRIRLRDLLSMTPGFEWDEDRFPYGDPRNSETAMDAAADRVRFVLERPIAAAPGATFTYNGGTTLVLAEILRRVTTRPLDQYAWRELFEPLGIRRLEWLRYADGTPIAASGLRLRPRDMAALGQLVLQDGAWRGRQLVPSEWIRQSTSPQVRISRRPLGFQRYGFQWWLGTGRVSERDLPFVSAVGYGGQRIMILRSLDLVLVLTAGLYQDRRQTDTTFAILLDRVLPAVTAR